MAIFLFLLVSMLLVGGLIAALIGISDEILYSFLSGLGAVAPFAFIISFIYACRRERPAWYLAILAFMAILPCVLLVFVVFAAPPEGIFILYPNIDTRFAPGYSEETFNNIPIGMSESEVLNLLREPLVVAELNPDWRIKEEPDTVWSYTGDGASRWGDFAWRGRAVYFRDGKVVRKLATWHFD